MTERCKASCPLFHDFGEHCCPPDAGCIYDETVKIIPLEPKYLADDLAAEHSTYLLGVLGLIFAFLTLYGLLSLN